MQFIKVHCTVNASSAIKCLLKMEQLSAERFFNAGNKKYHDGPKRKKQSVRKRYEDKNNSIKLHKEERYVENRPSSMK